MGHITERSFELTDGIFNLMPSASPGVEQTQKSSPVSRLSTKTIEMFERRSTITVHLSIGEFDDLSFKGEKMHMLSGLLI